MTNDTLNRPRWWLLYWKSLFASPGRAFWSCSYIAFVILGWWIPNDVFVRYPETQPFADFMADLIPQIRRAGELGGAVAGNANRFLYSVMWAAMPLYGSVMAFQAYRYNSVHGPRERMSFIRAIALMMVGLFMAYNGLFLPFSGTSHASAAVWRNPLVRSLYAPMLASSPLLFCIIFLFYIRSLLNGKLLRKSDHG